MISPSSGSNRQSSGPSTPSIVTRSISSGLTDALLEAVDEHLVAGHAEAGGVDRALALWR
jgi:nanoRNase/pAp phosphatase (c-di-AMP/oligoRNAs hydrolase)